MPSMPSGSRSESLVPALVAGFIPFVGMLVGIPFVNSTTNVGGVPLLGLWLLIWVVLTPPFLLLAHRLLPASEREEEQR